MVLKSLLVLASMLVLGGCAGSLGLRDANGWTINNRDDFLSLYKDDPYLSACGMESMYQQYTANHDTGILTQMLVKYVNNLANSCIDTASFKRDQAAKSKSKIKTYFELNHQEITASDIMDRLNKGITIEDILAPYIPQTPQFKKLMSYYKAGEHSDKMRKIRLNIERAKLISKNGWDNYIEVNVPEFVLRFYEGSGVSMEFPVITGKPAWQTPIFSSNMKYIVLNPTWTMTSNIVRDDLIKRVLKDPSYLKRHNMKVYDGFDADAEEIDPKTIDWKKYYGKGNKTPIPFRVVQGSSTKNALGTVKFMFPNRFSVYMHDTQKKSLFKQKQRAFSHGCMRLSKPNDLLKKVATEYAATSQALLQKRNSSHKVSYIKLQKEIPVHVIYQTAYVDGSGLHMYPDVYGFDKSQKVLY